MSVAEWKIWENKGLTPLINFNFTLQVEGIYNLPCKSVHVFQRENEYEYYQEGGLNDYVHLLRKPLSKPLTFQVERYVGVDILDPLALGTELILPVLLSVSRYQGEGAAGGWEQPQRIYTFTGCTVIAKEYGELNAENAGLLVETTTIAYREMVCVDNPLTGITKESWSDEQDKSGKPKTKYARTPKDVLQNVETSQDEKGKWKIKIDKDTDGRPKTRFAEEPKGMLSKAEMKARAHMYVDDNVQEKPMHILDYEGKKVSSKKNYKTGETKIGIADKRVMTPRKDLEKEAKRYFLDGSVSSAKYQGIAKASAATQKQMLGKAAVTKTQMKKNARRYYEKNAKVSSEYKGKREASAVTYEMEKKADLEKNAKRYFLSRSKLQAAYKGKMGTSAVTRQQELNQTELEGMSKRYFLDDSTQKDSYKGATGTSAVTQQELSKTEWEGMSKRYFFDDSKRTNSYKGDTGTSAVTQEQMLGQAAMTKAQMEQAAKRRQWPPNRSAAQVAAFLKKK